MKRKMKTAAVLTAGALMTIGASGMAFAATAHWEQEGEDWVYFCLLYTSICSSLFYYTTKKDKGE